MKINPKQTTEEPSISGSRTNPNDAPNLALYNFTQAVYESPQARRGCLWNSENTNNPKEIDTRKTTKPNDSQQSFNQNSPLIERNKNLCFSQQNSQPLKWKPKGVYIGQLKTKTNKCNLKIRPNGLLIAPRWP